MDSAKVICNGIVVVMSDFGLRERFVASMKGVALSVDKTLNLQDLTHNIEPYNINEASQTLAGTLGYWPMGSVFISVVDPGVGTERKSVVALTKSGHLIVTPDNGTLTQTVQQHGILAVREIDETISRLPGSSDIHTFHGRDIYSYTGAKLAAGVISFAEVGKVMEEAPVCLKLAQPVKFNAHAIRGQITRIEQRYGNVVTNIPKSMLDDVGVEVAKKKGPRVQISREGLHVYSSAIPYVKSFAFVEEGAPLLYIDSVGFLGLALNGDSFSGKHKVESGSEWLIEIRK